MTIYEWLYDAMVTEKVAEYWQMVKSVTLRGRSFSKEAHPSSLYQIHC